MITVVDTSGFYIHDCDDVTFEQSIAKKINSLTPGLKPDMPGDRLIGQLYMDLNSLKTMKKLKIETCYLNVNNDPRNYVKTNLKTCEPLLKELITRNDRMKSNSRFVKVKTG